MSNYGLLYRLKQKSKYHFSNNEFEKRIAEINRNNLVISTTDKSFKIISIPELVFLRPQHEFVIDRLDLLLKLYRGAGSISICEDNVHFTSHNGIKQIINTAEEIFILNEIWNNGCYSFLINSNKPIVLFDVGMNVGFASLFFSSIQAIQHIYAFEPFLPTYQNAIHNINLNAEAIAKITPINVGLSNRDQILEVDYSNEHRGRIGIWGTDLVYEKINQIQKERLELRDFSKTIKPLLEKHTGFDVVLKIDCEGSEYEILESLDISLLSNTKCIMIEWHNNGPKVLSDKLNKAGFSLLSLYPTSNVGMLYGFK